MCMHTAHTVHTIPLDIVYIVEPRHRRPTTACFPIRLAPAPPRCAAPRSLQGGELALCPRQRGKPCTRPASAVHVRQRPAHARRRMGERGRHSTNECAGGCPCLSRRLHRIQRRPCQPLSSRRHTTSATRGTRRCAARTAASRAAPSKVSSPRARFYTISAYRRTYSRVQKRRLYTHCRAQPRALWC